MRKFEHPFGATAIDADEMDGLKLRHLTTRGELDRWEQQNIQDALEWLEKRKKSDILTEEFLCRLHIKMFEKVWKWAGSFRRSDKNIGVDWKSIPVHLRQLLDDVKFWIENKAFDTDEIAARFHHRLVWIHLFPNGNGRHARLMTDVLLSETFDAEPFSWGSGNLSDTGDLRKAYIEALKLADKQDYSLLVKFVRS